MLSTTWAGVRTNGEAMLRHQQVPNRLPLWATLFSWNHWTQWYAWRQCIHIPVIGLNSMLSSQNLASADMRWWLVWRNSNFTNDLWWISNFVRTYCTISLCVPLHSGLPFLEDGLSWGNQYQELYVHQICAAETNGCQPLRHGKKVWVCANYPWSSVRAHYCHLPSAVTVRCLFPSQTKGQQFCMSGDQTKQWYLHVVYFVWNQWRSWWFNASCIDPW